MCLCQHPCYRNATMPYPCMLFTTCSCQQYKYSVLPRKYNNVFLLPCCRVTKYFVLLSTISKYLGLYVKCPIISSDFNKIWSFSTDFCPQFQISQKYKTPPHADGWPDGWSDGWSADGRTDMMSGES